MRRNITVIICIIFVLTLAIILIQKENEKEINTEMQNEAFTNNYEKIDKSQTSYQENVTVEELKKDVGIKGDNDIYDVQTEYDGRKVLTVKADLKFKVAFCGMIKNSIPKMEELDEVFQNRFPQKSGVWIETNSKDKVIKLINNSKKVKSKYAINNNGYLYVEEKNAQTDLDKKIENAINSDKLNILAKSSICYIVDDVTGEILDYNFEKMDKYQTYELFQNDDKKIIYITENSGNQLNNDNILEDIVELLEKGL